MTLRTKMTGTSHAQTWNTNHKNMSEISAKNVLAQILQICMSDFFNRIRDKVMTLDTQTTGTIYAQTWKRNNRICQRIFYQKLIF